MRKPVSICLFVVVLVFAVTAMAPDASAQLGQYDCRECHRICWEGLFVFESCEHFCVQSTGTNTGYEECYPATSWCLQRDRCLRVIA